MMTASATVTQVMYLGVSPTAARPMYSASTSSSASASTVASRLDRERRGRTDGGWYFASAVGAPHL